MSDSSTAGKPGEGEIRAGDADRERLVAELHEHTVAGRLSSDELEQRLAEVYSARTTTELDALRRDLPSSSSALNRGAAERRSRLRRQLFQQTGGALSLFVVCAVIWIASGGHGSFWPIWILLVAIMPLLRGGWALWGPAPDLDAVEGQLNARQERRAAHDERRGRRRVGP